jgi:hypothetical protein
LHVHHHYAPAAAPAAEQERGPLEKHGQWILLGFAGLPLAAGAVAIVAVTLIVAFGAVVAGFQAMAGSLLALGIVAVLGIAAWKAPAGKGKK